MQLTVVLAVVRDQMIERDVIDHVVALDADVVHLHGFVRPLLARV